jgi:hypothetical protein
MVISNVLHDLCLSLNQPLKSAYDWHIFFCCAVTQRRSWPPHSWGLLDQTQQRTTVDRTLLDKWSARRRDLTTHNTYNRQKSMPPVRFKPTISVGERPQTYALDSTATGTGMTGILEYWKIYMIWYDMIWYDMIWYDMIWYDMIWYDMIWYMICDMIWYDIIWYDIWYDMIYI